MKDKIELDDNFTKTHQSYLEVLDMAYTRLRNELYDPDMVQDNPHYIGASENFEEIKSEILALKRVWHLARNRLV